MSNVSYVRTACKEKLYMLLDDLQLWGEEAQKHHQFNKDEMHNFICWRVLFTFPQEYDLKSKVAVITAFDLLWLIYMHYTESDFRSGGEVRIKTEQQQQNAFSTSG